MTTLSPVTIENETELAWLVNYEGRLFWVPKSECKIDSEELKIPFWMAEDKGMV